MIVPQDKDVVQSDPDPSNPQGLQKAFRESQKRIRQLEAEVRRLQQVEQEHHLLRRKAGWIAKLLSVPNSTMSGNQKISLIGAVNAYEGGTPDNNGLVHIIIKRECKRYGLAASTMGDALTYCASEIGAITRQDIKVRDPDTGTIVATETYIGLTELTYRPYLYEVEKARNQGGQREKGKGKKYEKALIYCRDCQTAHIERRIDFFCMDCGQRVAETEKSYQDEEGKFHRVVNLTSNIKTRKPRRQFDRPVVIESREPVAPLDDGEDVLTSQAADTVATDNLAQDMPPIIPQVEDLPDEEGIADQVQNTSIPQDTNSSEQEPAAMPQIDKGVLRAAAELYTSLVTPQQDTEKVYAEMSVNGAKKYYDEPGAFTAKLAYAHIAGSKTIAARIGRHDGTTRAALWDADNDLNWQKLKDAARLLAEEGYAMLVEPSPAARGGHIGTLISEFVEARAVYQHMCQIAPVLAEFKEYWLAPGSGSGNKVRLFCGYYRHQGVNKWCVLQDADGNVLAKNGRESAIALLTYHTPAELIPPYQEPEEPEDAPIIVNAVAARAIQEQISDLELECLLGREVRQKPLPVVQVRLWLLD